MPQDHHRRALMLLLLGLGTFFIIAAALLAGSGLLAGVWQLELEEVALLALLISVPAGFLLWRRFGSF